MDNDLKELLNRKYLEYNRGSFVENDPISIPHLFTEKEDIEISAFLVATIAWGNRKSIITNGKKLLAILDNSPSDFVRNHKQSDLIACKDYVHRTFNEIDLSFFLSSLQNIYLNHNGLEAAFAQKDIATGISEFKALFFSIDHLKRTEKHVSDPKKGSAAKRINMFLRWMVRKDANGVDFGIWDSIKATQLKIPLDVHTSTVGRKLGLLKRKQNDWKAVEELTSSLIKLDPLDPVKYDFALFGMGESRELV